MPWTPLENRDGLTKKLISDVKANFNSPEEFEAFYNENDYGLLSSDDLNQKLLSISRTDQSPISSQNTDFTPENIEMETNVGHSAYIAEGDSYECRSLRYLRSNAKRPEDREWAELLYSRTLLDLWRQYVMNTGETYYPPLAEDLLKFFEFEEENN